MNSNHTPPICWNLIKRPLTLSISSDFMVELAEGGLLLWYPSRGIEFEPRPRIFPLRVILTRSPYGGSHVAQTSGPSERSGRVLAGT
jgi:hypothetical protein